MDQTKTKALELLETIAREQVQQIIERWRYSKTPEDREQCAVDLRAVEELSIGFAAALQRARKEK